MSATVTANRVLTTERDAQLARGVLRDLEGPEGFLLVGKTDAGFERVPHDLGVLLQQVLTAIAAGSTLTVSAIPAELTTSSAANLIGVSRPTLMKMIAAGELPAHKVGSHTRLQSGDVFDFLRARRERQRAAFDALRDLLDD